MGQTEAEIQTVLLVEDDDEWAKIFTDVLKKAGNRVEVVRSATEAREVLNGEKPIARVVTDGLEGNCVRVVRAAQQRGLPVKVVSSDYHLRRDLGEQGLEVDFVAKRDWVRASAEERSKL